MARSKIAGNGHAYARQLGDALHRLAVARSMAEAIETKEGLVGLDDKDAAGMVRLAIVDAGSAIEEALLHLGVIRDQGAPWFIDRPISAA